jgi:succinate dehydrogenase/fumarate reductase flavoprotein subunit
MVRLAETEVISCDVLVIGGGGAGLRAAIEAREQGSDVLLVSKSRVGYGSNTFLSKGNLAAAIGRPDLRDNPGIHYEDTLRGGRSINNPGLAAQVTNGICDEIRFLERCGVTFLKDSDGEISVKQTPGHRYARRVSGATQRGRDFTFPLRNHALAVGVRFVENTFVTKLLEHEEDFAGAVGIAPDGRVVVFTARCAVLATGGFARVYLNTDNARGATGDGQALAFDIGVHLQDMEFVQFYPTALGLLGTRILLYEVFVSDAGAVLRNSEGQDILQRYGLGDTMAMTRDLLSRAVMREIIEGRDVQGCVCLDISNVQAEKLQAFSHLIPGAYQKGDGRDTRKRFLVSPTAHFCMGGIAIGANAETEVPGLFAAGEVCGGAHGANRLGANSLSEVFAMGARAGRSAALRARQVSLRPVCTKAIEREKNRLESLFRRRGAETGELSRRLKGVMWRMVGILRSRDSLDKALLLLKELGSAATRIRIESIRDLMRAEELKHMLLVSEMVCRAALLRTESRGAHYREDCSEEDNRNWLKNIIVRRQDEGIALEARPL